MFSFKNMPPPFSVPQIKAPNRKHIYKTGIFISYKNIQM